MDTTFSRAFRPVIKKLLELPPNSETECVAKYLLDILVIHEEYQNATAMVGKKVLKPAAEARSVECPEIVCVTAPADTAVCHIIEPVDEKKPDYPRHSFWPSNQTDLDRAQAIFNDGDGVESMNCIF